MFFNNREIVFILFSLNRTNYRLYFTKLIFVCCLRCPKVFDKKVRLDSKQRTSSAILVKIT